jgi:hypothetical protein
MNEPISGSFLKITVDGYPVCAKRITPHALIAASDMHHFWE